MARVANRSGSSRKGSQREARQRHQQWPCHPDGAAATGDRRNPEVIEAVRSGSHQVARNETDAELSPIAESSRIALEKALDEGFTKSGLRGVITGLWIPGTGSWIASRGVSDLKTKASMTADLQAPIGSITKSFTVTIALQLVGEGKLRREDTIERWDPQIAEAFATTKYRRNMISLTN